MTILKTREFSDRLDFVTRAQVGERFRQVTGEIGISDYVVTEIRGQGPERTLELRSTHTSYIPVMHQYMTTANPLQAWIEAGAVRTTVPVGSGEVLGRRERVAEPSATELFGAHQIATRR